jgi:hypothetical protein
MLAAERASDDVAPDRMGEGVEYQVCGCRIGPHIRSFICGLPT